jgi:hypothetical protein
VDEDDDDEEDVVDEEDEEDVDEEKVVAGNTVDVGIEQLGRFSLQAQFAFANADDEHDEKQLSCMAQLVNVRFGSSGADPVKKLL